MKIVWLSDLHLVSRGGLLYGRDPEKQLQVAIDNINTHHADATYCVLSGDLVDDPGTEVYNLLAEKLSGLKIPYLPMVGNHDDREMVKACLSVPELNSGSFIQYVVMAGGWRLIMLDTVKSGQMDGEICDERLQWLRAELEKDQKSPTLIFSHHPLLPLNLPMQDQESLKSGEQLLSVLQAANNVRHWCFGHVHRPVSGSFDNLGFTAMQSIAIQAPLPYPAWDWESFRPADELPAFGIIHLARKSAVVHFQQFKSN